MQISFLIATIIGLVMLLGVLFFLVFKGNKKSESFSAKKVQEVFSIDLQTLLNTIKNKNTSTEELQVVVNTVLKDFGIIKEDDFNLYAQMLLKISAHPNTNANIILALDRGLSNKNPTHKKMISSLTSQGLNSREV